MWIWMGLFLRKNVWRFWGRLSLLNWIRALTLYLLLKMHPRKLEPSFILWSFSLLRLLCISINLLLGHLWNTVVMSELVLLVATWNCWWSYKNGYVGPSPAPSLESLAHRRNVARLSLFYKHYFGKCSSELAQLVPLILEAGLLVILIDCMIFLSPFLDVTKMSMSTVSMSTDSGILCL